jgi:two-component system, cell cycle sensor histidine kinase and response regulator CckA
LPPLRVLIVEDSEDDCALVLRELQRGGYDVAWERVADEASARDALGRGGWELVLSDFNLPGLSALTVLPLRRQYAPDVPFIVVSGSIEESQAVEVLKAGADDFVTKHNFARLCPAIARELREAERRRLARETEERLRLDRERQAQALQEAERTFRALFEANPTPMWVYDRETLGFLEVNDAAVARYGHSRREFLALRITDIRPAEDVPALMESLEHRDVDMRLRPRSFRHRAKDGGVLEVEIASHDLVFNGRPGVLVVAHDVTERQQLQRQLLQAQKMEAIGQLAGGVAHDFNNLLGVIAGTTELILSALGREHPARPRAEQALAAVSRAAGLTRQLLAFSRRQIVERRVLDLNRLVTETAQMLQRLIGEDVDLRCALDPDLTSIRADPGEIEQVVMNLAVNARDAMPRGGKLTLETQNVVLDAAYAQAHAGVAAGRYILLAVSDTGTGIAPEIRARIFEPFFTTKELGKGTGLGLSTVYGIVKDNGGHVALYSEPGRGTVFKLYFPAIGAAAEGPEAAPETMTIAGSETILLVEDEAALRLIVSELLQEQGYVVLEAKDGADALRISDKHAGRIDVLMTDVVMPNMSGRELVERISSQRPETKVIFVSGYTDDAVVRHGVLSADVAFLQKPFRLEAVAQKIRAVLDAEPRGEAN